MERKLASIQKILTLEPIEGADKIEKATVLGWALVVKKGEFHVGEACVYCEVDSVMPDKPEFEFLRQRKFRIKTVRLRGQVSQGIAFPLDILTKNGYVEGMDVSEELGVTKFEPPIPTCLAGKVKGRFPGFLPKTDEIRIQAVPDVLKRHNGKVFYATEKVDGASMTVSLRDGEFDVCSRNLNLFEDKGNTLWQVARKLELEEKLKKMGRNFALQGELLGPGIQKNRYGLKEHKFLIFNAFDIDAYRYLNVNELRDLLTEDLGLEMVPYLGEYQLTEKSVDDLVQYSKGESKLKEGQMREGVVLRPFKEEKDEELGRLSFKVINPNFLLKYED